MTPQEYLAIERAALDRSEFINGAMRPLAYGGACHSLVGANVAGTIGPKLRGGLCRGYAGNLRLHVPATGLYTYADLSVICGAARVVEDGENDLLLNPTVIVEIIIPETEAYDRGEKFASHYRHIESLREYVLVDRDRPRVETYTRQEDCHHWTYNMTDGRDGVAVLGFVGIELPLAEIYDGVEFPPTADLPPTSAALQG